ncbi:hypothetical protein DL96DRAFT_1724715 [Flagelloscypha sp. PMI_526]|nr:hypothetical protein DL96DRAFT_1724715 [Flagelloscypha sp. PMI_526]
MSQPRITSLLQACAQPGLFSRFSYLWGCHPHPEADSASAQEPDPTEQKSDDEADFEDASEDLNSFTVPLPETPTRPLHHEPFDPTLPVLLSSTQSYHTAEIAHHLTPQALLLMQNFVQQIGGNQTAANEALLEELRIECACLESLQTVLGQPTQPASTIQIAQPEQDGHGQTKLKEPDDIFNGSDYSKLKPFLTQLFLIFT